jgi:ferredoxin
MKRRNALQTLAAGAAILAAGAAPYGFASVLAPRQARAQRNYLRPPGAIENDRAFTAACIGCGLCGEVCPPRCIRFHTRDGGDGGGVNTPYIDPEESACTLCNKCMEVCPTEALTVVPRDSIDMGTAQIDRDACYPWVDRGICGACVSICPLGEKAISFKMWKQYRPAIQQGCVGCGLCVEVCPHPSKPIWIVKRTPETNEAVA